MIKVYYSKEFKVKGGCPLVMIYLFDVLIYVQRTVVIRLESPILFR